MFPRQLALLALTLAALLWPVLAGAAPAVTSLEAWADLDGTVQVRWTTAPATKGQVEYGATRALGQTVPEDPGSLRGTTNNSDSGIGVANNHRAALAGVKAWPVFVRVTGADAQGQPFASDPVSVAAAKLPASRAVREQLTLSLNPGAWQLPKVPYTVGVPFPAGMLARAEQVRVLLGGQETPSQAVVVTRWHKDNSIKWLRLDFVAPVSAKMATVEYGAQVRRAAYGPNAQPAGAPAQDDDPVITLTDATGKTYLSRSEAQVTEENGPVKHVLRVRGHHVAADGTKLCAYTLRYHMWPALGVMRVDYTLENDNAATEFTALRSLELSDPDPGQPTTATVGAGDAPVTLSPGQRVLQREDFEWVKEPTGEKGKRLEGLVTLGGQNCLVVRDFWQQWPASVEMRATGPVIGLCPALPEGFYAGRKDEEKLYYQVRDGLHSFRLGFSKTWEIWMLPAGPQAATLLGDRPVAMAAPAWIEDSGALRKLAVAVRDQFAGYDETLTKSMASYAATQDARREYGLMNYGDWFGERTWNWGNVEYDLGHAFLTQFVRTGEPVFFWRGEEAIRHERDVDTRHYATDPRRVGQQWIHSMGHTAGYYPRNYKDMELYSSPGWSDNRGHIWCQGMLEHYLLGGDARSWETGQLIADWAAGPQTTNFIFGNAREPGWMTKLVMSAYFATEDPYYLNAARLMLDATHEKAVASGNRGFFYHVLPKGHCDCPDDQKHSGEAGFMLGVLMTGMKMYYDVTGDTRVADDLAKTARFVADTMWVPEQMGFRYTPCPKTSSGNASSWIMMEGLAFGARWAKDAQLADVCRTALSAGWTALPTSGKTAGYVLCASAQALEEVSRLPGPSFAAAHNATLRQLSSPVRRLLPTLVPNPDFEAEIVGWPGRAGAVVTQATDVKHSGAASLKITGQLVRQGEYVNTSYDTTGSPYEIAWLKPGEKYRLSCWLRVDRVAPGTPAPSMRIAFRDVTGTRGGTATSAYDLTKLGTWQQLSAEFTIPDYNTRNYLALNTNSIEAVEAEMYLDDISLVPAAAAAAGPYAYLRLNPETAQLSGGAQVTPRTGFFLGSWLGGPGEAQWPVDVPAAGEYRLWARVDANTKLGALLGDQTLSGASGDVATWLLLGKQSLPAGPVTVKIPALPGTAAVRGLLLTNDPTSGL